MEAMRKKVLVVDNNKVILRLMTNFLEKNGYEVMAAENGLAGLEILESFRPDFMFIDLIMPKINGEKLCRIIRNMPEHAHVGLIIVSAIAAESFIDFAAFGADACIAKGPFKGMQEHIIRVLEHLKKGEHAELRQRIFGGDTLFERQITKELLAAQKHFQISMDSMADGFLELSTEARIIYANRTTTEIFGKPEEKLLSSYFPDLLPAESRHELIALLQEQEREEAGTGANMSLAVGDKFLYLKFVPFQDHNQRFTIVLVHDITKLKRTEQELLAHKEQLEELVAKRTAELKNKNEELEKALAQVKTLSGLLPICAACKKIRDDNGYWNQIEAYIKKHSNAEFSHSICPDCAKKLYPELF